jgi:3,4-dihydroxy 2-butanone 4-phosphate synthase / GTP cyclohydrolase II
VEGFQFHSAQELIADLKQGRMVILIDDEDRENEGDLVLPAQFADGKAINFMALHARGLICLALAGRQADRLGLRPMVGFEENKTPNKTAFTVSIEASQGVTTGISAADRAHTIRVASDPKAKPGDIRSPGHIFPIRAQEGGVLKRAGHTEGSVDLMTLSGLWPAAVICEIMKDDGTMARVPDLMVFSEKFSLKIGTIASLIEYRLERETLVQDLGFVKDSEIPQGWSLRVFESLVDGWQHLVYQKGVMDSSSTPLVRIQQDDYLRHVRDILLERPTSLAQAFKKCENQDSALILLLRGSEKDPHIVKRLSYFSQEGTSFFVDSRNYGIGAQILRACGVKKFRLLAHRSYQSYFDESSPSSPSSPLLLLDSSSAAVTTASTASSTTSSTATSSSSSTTFLQSKVVEKRVGLKSFGLELIETITLP